MNGSSPKLSRHESTTASVRDVAVISICPRAGVGPSVFCRLWSAHHFADRQRTQSKLRLPFGPMSHPSGRLCTSIAPAALRTCTLSNSICAPDGALSSTRAVVSPSLTTWPWARTPMRTSPSLAMSQEAPLSNSNSEAAADGPCWTGMSSTLSRRTVILGASASSRAWADSRTVARVVLAIHQVAAASKSVPAATEMLEASSSMSSRTLRLSPTARHRRRGAPRGS